MGLEWIHKWKFKIMSTCTTKKRGRLMQVKNGSCAADLIGTTSNTSFTQHTTFEKRHHSPPYSIFYASLHGPHPNVVFSQYSQVGVPKLGLLLSRNFGHSFLSQIKSISRMQGKYVITLINIFPMVYSTLQSDFIWSLLSRDLWSEVKFSIWLSPLLLIKNHANQV
jgi:hypothetical protein